MAHRKEREIANCTLISAQELNLFNIIKGRGQKPKHTGNYIFKIIIDSFAVSALLAIDDCTDSTLTHIHYVQSKFHALDRSNRSALARVSTSL